MRFQQILAILNAIESGQKNIAVVTPNNMAQWSAQDQLSHVFYSMVDEYKHEDNVFEVLGSKVSVIDIKNASKEEMGLSPVITIDDDFWTEELFG